MKNDFNVFLDVFVEKSVFPNRELLPTYWQQAKSVLEVYPNRYPWIVEPAESPASWIVDQKSLNTWYWSDIVKRINVVIFISAAKLRDLFTGLERSLIENNILLSALISRSLIENIGTLHWSSKLIISRLKNIDLAKLDKRNVVDERLENELIRMTHGSRFNWKAWLNGEFDDIVEKPNKVPEVWQQRNVLGYIDKLAKHKRYSSLRLIYDLLCEFVHPNLGSNLIYVKQEEEIDIGVRIHMDASHNRANTIAFLEPLTGALLLCCEVAFQTLPEITEAVEPLSKWCQKNYISYARKKNRASH